MGYILNFKKQELAYDISGSRYWKAVGYQKEYKPSEMAVIVVDMWDKHWSKGATRRCEVIANNADVLLRRLRGAGVFIVHAPSDTMGFYESSKARKRALDTDIIEMPVLIDLPDVPQPVSAAGGGSDTMDEYEPNTVVWRRQTDVIMIDEDRDIITDEGPVIYTHLKNRGIKLIIYIGVHTNMCILHRPFAIKAMLKAGFDTVLTRDLTDAMYNPEMPPYVSHAEGTRLIIEYIEKFYCPTIESGDLLAQRQS